MTVSPAAAKRLIFSSQEPTEQGSAPARLLVARGCYTIPCGEKKDFRPLLKRVAALNSGSLRKMRMIRGVCFLPFTRALDALSPSGW
jgi:hypothetical protein